MHRLAMCITCVFLPQIRGFAPSPINWVGSFFAKSNNRFRQLHESPHGTSTAGAWRCIG